MRRASRSLRLQRERGFDRAGGTARSAASAGAVVVRDLQAPRTTSSSAASALKVRACAAGVITAAQARHPVQGCKQRQSLAVTHSRVPAAPTRVTRCCATRVATMRPERTALDLCLSQEREPQERIVQLVRVGASARLPRARGGWLADRACESAALCGSSQRRLITLGARSSSGASSETRKVLRSTPARAARLGQIARDCLDAPDSRARSSRSSPRYPSPLRDSRDVWRTSG